MKKPLASAQQEPSSRWPVTKGRSTMKRLGVGQVTVLAALMIILILAAVRAGSVWNATGDAVIG